MDQMQVTDQAADQEVSGQDLIGRTKEMFVTVGQDVRQEGMIFLRLLGAELWALLVRFCREIIKGPQKAPKAQKARVTRRPARRSGSRKAKRAQPQTAPWVVLITDSSIVACHVPLPPDSCHPSKAEARYTVSR